ncbi:integral membrane protein [Thozetella sp. PMI_491]|nr:integral membrane protein [Thozetella sp. PMI_491]
MLPWDAMTAVALFAPVLVRGANGTSHVQSTFISPRQDLGFAINVPVDSTTDMYFAIAAPAGVTWAAVGLGFDKMPGSLILMVYGSSDGNNVTFSPRLASGHNEPTYYPDLQVEVLGGTGLYNDTYVFVGRCRNCRRWPGGSIDVTSASQPFTFGIGPFGTLNSDDPSASLRFHESFGVFNVDLTAATGQASVPFMNGSTTASSVGVVQGISEQGRRDGAAAAHAAIMVLAFTGLFPLGIVIIRLGDWVRWHAINQGVGLAAVIAGAGLGINISLSYNRSKGFRTPHQIIGLVVCLLLIAQFFLGLLHHQAHKRHGVRPRLAPWHIWVGRSAIVLGIVNGFLGFPLALAPEYDLILFGIVIAIAPVFLCLFVWKRFWKRHVNGHRRESAAGIDCSTARAEPGHWSQGVAQDIGLANFEHAARPGGERNGESGANLSLGPRQVPAEYL